MNVDRFDAVRRAWINDHRGSSTIQDRRQNVLGVKVRRRQREVTGAVPNPHEDTILPHIWWRLMKSPVSQAEWIGVNALALLAPIGWLLGYIAHRAVTRLIPSTLRAYPIIAMLAAAAALGLLAVICYQPDDSLMSAVLDAWISLQISTIPAVVGVYAILDGWLAIPGWKQWWPLSEQPGELTGEQAYAIIGSYDLTGPGLVAAAPFREDEQARPR